MRFLNAINIAIKTERRIWPLIFQVITLCSLSETFQIERHFIATGNKPSCLRTRPKLNPSLPLSFNAWLRHRDPALTAVEGSLCKIAVVEVEKNNIHGTIGARKVGRWLVQQSRRLVVVKCNPVDKRLCYRHARGCIRRAVRDYELWQS